ncbi:Helix-turn-helix protein [Opitutaceae bacterium TAV1]|nr:Helix-turn-helix protein [Opitutaceae bacterium TAV1]
MGTNNATSFSFLILAISLPLPFDGILHESQFLGVTGGPHLAHPPQLQFVESLLTCHVSTRAIIRNEPCLISCHLMSHLATVLKQLTQDRLQQDVADAAGIPRTTLGQYMRDSRGVSAHALDQLLKAFNESGQRVLLLAYLKDATPESWFGRIRIDFKKPGGKATNSSLSPDSPDVSPDVSVTDDKALSAALATLMARARENNDVRQVILDLEAIVR